VVGIDRVGRLLRRRLVGVVAAGMRARRRPREREHRDATTTNMRRREIICERSQPTPTL
jgi:hypothetical protein